MLQETHTSEVSNKNCEIEWGDKWFNSYGTNRSCGVSILFNPSLSYCVGDIITDTEGRFICMSVVIDNKTIICGNCYAPNADTPSFFEDIIKKLDDFVDNDLVILGGDFNLVIDPKIDRKNSLNNAHKSAEILKEYLNKAKMADSWRILNPDSAKFSWSRTNPDGSISASRLDMIFIPVAWCDKITECKIEPNRKSDHSLVSIEIRYDDIQRGPGTWKFNNNLLADSSFTDRINKVCQEINKFEGILNPDEYWVYLKKCLTNECKRYSKIKKRI